MKFQPTIKTKRLILRAFNIKDSSQVKELAGDKRIADVTANIPHPYPEELAREWILSHFEKWKNKKLVAFAITLADSRLLVGAISLMNMDRGEGELGYWIGVDYWGNGYCSEACRSLVDFGFNTLNLERIYAHHLSRNPASGKVLLNCGLTYIGSSKSVCGYRKNEESTETYEIYKKYKLNAVFDTLCKSSSPSKKKEKSTWQLLEK